MTWGVTAAGTGLEERKVFRSWGGKKGGVGSGDYHCRCWYS